MSGGENNGRYSGHTLVDEMRSEDLATELDSAVVDTSESAFPTDHVYLIIKHGTHRELRDMPAEGALTIGRGEEADIVVPEVKVSRIHACIKRRGLFIVLQDLNSTNGTKLNGSTIRGGERRVVSGDLIRVGRADITVAAAAGSALAARPAQSRLDLELSQRETATFLRIDLPPLLPTGTLEKMADVLNKVALVEERSEEGQYAALLDLATGNDAPAIIEQIRAFIPDAELSVANYPTDGQTISALWKASSRHGDDDEGDAPPSGVAVADPGMVKVFRIAQRVAKTATTALILGETGAGKEVLAEHIHRCSDRASKPYVRLNCASLPETLLVSELFGHEKGAFTGADRRKTGYFEAANGGTLLLDEIGELSLSMQVKLLRVLENRTVLRLGATEEIPVDVRVICATHRDLQADVATGRFREDLFYRVSAFTLQVPPLRERPTEIGLLTEIFIRQFSERMNREVPAITDQAIAVLTSHRWPGNVRELRNAVEHAFVMCDEGAIDVEHLPHNMQAPSEQQEDESSGDGGVRDKLAQIERASIAKALSDQDGNQTRAAKQLGMSRRALIYKMAKYGLKKATR